MVNAQAWLDENYLLSRRNEVTKLNTGNKNLTGELKLVGFGNLTVLNCWNNQLTTIDLSSCPSLTRLYCSDNQLTKLDVNKCPNLTEFSCNNNKLENLNFFKELENCQFLFLDNNPFTGILEVPQNFSKLKFPAAEVRCVYR